MQVLETEADVSCKRNAFLMLFHTAQDRAVAYLGQNLDQVATWGDILQLVVLELIRKIVRSNPYEKSKYIRCILTLFNSQSPAVVYECALYLPISPYISPYLPISPAVVYECAAA